MAVWLARISQLVAPAAVTAVIGMLIGSLDYNTTWENRQGFGVDGFWQWAALTLPLGGIALLLLLHTWEGLRGERGADRDWLRGAAIRSLIAAASCAAAGWIASRYWQSLLLDPADPDVTVRIAPGLPVVATGGSVGGLFAGLLALFIWWLRATNRSAPRHTQSERSPGPMTTPRDTPVAATPRLEQTINAAGKRITHR
ncbi:MAG: hypothetical protein U0031_12655 [Thermomicrobiales bacterium]